MYDYPDILTAAQGLLAESVGIVKPLGLSFVIVGGWSPFLCNGHPIRHPGTRDVDILFLDGREPYCLEEVVQRFLDGGYLLSAKHHFQLLRELQVNGKPLIFNVDLLHPMETAEKPELYTDQLNLPVRISRFEDEFVRMKSIALPIAGELFPLHQRPFSVDCTLPTGLEHRIDVPLMDEVGTIVTKAGSVDSKKRTRDAFDIFLAMTQGDRPATVAGLREFISERDGQVAEFKPLVDVVYNTVFANNTMRHLAEVGSVVHFSHDEITRIASDFLSEATISVAT
jgi:hypothetical protein